MLKKRVATICSVTLIAMTTLVGCSTSNQATSENSTSNSGQESESSSSESKVFRLAHVVAPDENHPYTVTAESFKKYVEEKTNGKIKINIFPGGQLGGDTDLLEMVRKGTLDLGVISGPVLANYTPVQAVLDLPWLYNNNLELMHEAFTSEIGQKVLERMSKDVGVKGLAYSYQGFRHFITNKPVQSIEDLQGMKFRTQQSPLHVQMFQTIGMSPTPIPFPELYSSMQTGVIDGFETDLFGYDTSKFYEVGKYVSLSGHFNNTELLLMSNEIFDKLSPEEQKIIQEGANFATEEAYKKSVNLSDEYLERSKKNGAVVTELDISKLKEMVQPVYDEWLAKDPLIEEYVTYVEGIKKN
ncbi:TRAP transporter substrate-binding protein [Ammoniphilus resinae]|uniref:C4-dicarboxylate-binding protein DctP n=1 Tax=Ammoniphilus resinae TaxID=861532 RepID=A0ABS4GSS0_9BACL|nr:TRAP transporter substrate-binding protein [Ammoniphilus resinae]MBP1933279.1 C4-dicarboxylate-binding protein DctP [Ammoniphilus resinae]